MAEKLLQASEEELFQVLEEKLMILLSKREDIIRENQRLSDENTALKNKNESNVQKLEVLISLLGTGDIHDKATTAATEIPASSVPLATLKPVLVQG
jgi:hypothetical protein